jgi:CubicO group peptidase (beta-lactamase class C family)
LAARRKRSRKEHISGYFWQKTAPGKLGWSVGKLDTVFAFAKSLGPGGMIIIDHGLAVGDWGATDYRSKIASVRKSLLSALYGIHVQAGEIDLNRTLAQLGIDDKPPGLTASEKQATIRMLLQARSGIYAPAVGEMPVMLATQPERGSHAINTFWYYNNWDFNALGTIFEQQTQTKIPNEFLTKIATPIGMQDLRIQDCYYTPGEESIHPAYHFRMTGAGFGRFGYLYLRQGKWQDKQLILAAWIRESTTAYSDVSTFGNYGGYGYMWWVAKDGRHFPGASVKDGGIVPGERVEIHYRPCRTAIW